ncbi:MAG TPA: NAD(P)-dependent oxidoreductase [Allosphingosinicella sp.]|jgi:nucleoside-diphosphate-sugar epimerase|nr:NAD(P)-dependent oxidoreductase [Allosphingosinicella sp.]
MRILVTGAAGLIGSAVAARLRGEHYVTGLDLRPGNQVDLLHDIRTPLRLDGYDAVVHVAALHAPHVGRASDAEFRAVNVDATDRLLDSALAAGVARFVYTSSTSVFGHALVPANGRAAWIDEDVEPDPRDIYDETKLAAEALVRAAGLPSAILRISRCFPEPLRDMALHRLHRGIDRRDVVEVHALALAAASGGCETYVVSAIPPFTQDDREELCRDAPSAIRRRASALAAGFDRRGWPLPPSLGRIYSPATAAARLGFTARFGAGSVLAGDCDPLPHR